MAKKKAQTRKNHTVSTKELPKTEMGNDERPSSPVKKFLRIVGMIVFIAFSFALGNLVGTYLIPAKYTLNLNWQLPSLAKFLPQKPTTAPSGQKGAQGPVMVKIGNTEVKQPGPSSSTEEQETFMNAISSAAVETTSVSIGESCAMTPQVVRARPGTTLQFANSTTTSFTLAIGDKDGSLSLGPNETKTIEAYFRGAGVYNVSCDKGSVGFIQVVAP